MHSSGFKLEYTLGISSGIQREHLRIVYRNLLYIYFCTETTFYQCQTSVYDRKRLKSQKVHFEHTHIFNLGAFILTHPHLLTGGLISTHGYGNIIGKIAPTDNHRAGMDTGLPDTPFQLKRVFEHFAYKRLSVLIFILELGYQLDTVGKSRFILLVFPIFLDHNRPVRNHLGKPVGLRNGQVGDACHILYGQFCGHCAKCDYMRHMIGPIMLLDILNDTETPFIVKIHIDIRHRYSFRIKETLEKQVIPYRVEVGDSKTVGHT